MAKKKNQWTLLNSILIVALVLVVGAGLYFSLNLSFTTPEIEPPRELTVTFLGMDCADCIDLSSALDSINQLPSIKVVKVENKTIAQSAELAAKYNITRYPAFVIGGDINNYTVEGLTAFDDALVFSQTPVPYYDVASKRVVGLVDVTLIEADCDECFNISTIVTQLQGIGVAMDEITTLPADSPQAKTLLSQYNIKKLPAMLMSKDALLYPPVAQAWPQAGTTESDGTLVLRYINPPYLDTTTETVKGLIKITYLSDESCAECYDSHILRDIFAQTFNLAIGDEEALDSASTRGMFLIKKYNITALPTALLSSDADEYMNFDQSWVQIGTVEDDRTYVFRSVDLLQGYFTEVLQEDGFVYVENGTVVNTAPANTTA